MLVVAALGVALQVWGSELEVEPIIQFGDPADAVRVTLARAHLARVTGTRVNAGGIAVQVDFEAADWPELVIRPTGESVDWMGVQALTIPFDNPTAEPIDLLVRVDDDAQADGEHHSLSGRARLRPNDAGALVLPLPTNDALTMGMVAGPPREAPRLDGPVRMIWGARGAIDRRHLTAIHLILLRRSSGRTLIFGDLGIIRGADPGPEAYQSIVDGFGQYTRAHWDGKIGSNDDLQRARSREEQQLREWLPPPVALDRYGGLLEGPSFDATGFFRTEQREGRWWLVTPDGHGFFSLGIDVVGPDIGATFVEGREFMFAELPGLGDPLTAHYGHGDEHGSVPEERGRHFDHGRSFDFYAANLQRKYGADYLPLWRRTAPDRLRAWGFNTIGNWSEPHLLERHEMAYVVPIHVYGKEGNFARVGSGWGKMPDPFDPAFVAAVDGDVMKAASAYRGDPYLIGYFVDNELAWGLGQAADPELRYGLAVETLRLGAGAARQRGPLSRSSSRNIGRPKILLPRGASQCLRGKICAEPAPHCRRRRSQSRRSSTIFEHLTRSLLRPIFAPSPTQSGAMIRSTCIWAAVSRRGHPRRSRRAQNSATSSALMFIGRIFPAKSGRALMHWASRS